MRHVFLSFLGLGLPHKGGYEPTQYVLGNKKSKCTSFVQAAEIEILGANNFDSIIIVATQKSHDLHFLELSKALEELGAKEISPIIISEEMTAQAQWEWFEKILPCIESGDELTVDLTHGYRAIPIVFSTAINFLQKAKNIRLKGAYYAAFEKNRDLVPIVDMRDFYIVNEWAEAVSRLVEDADARKMAQVAERAPDFQCAVLNSKDTIKALQELTATVRNVDVNNISSRATAALRLLRQGEAQATVTERILVSLLLEKFAILASESPASNKYDADYFRLQAEIVRLLLEHQLYMQAYTVMRELIASIGMIPINPANMASSDGRKQRRYGDLFFRMLQYPEEEWRFKCDEYEMINSKLRDFYEELKKKQVEPLLRGFVKELAEYRNGFDHAWTLKQSAKDDIEEKGRFFLDRLEQAIRILFPFEETLPY